jgi:hypothetical protein
MIRCDLCGQSRECTPSQNEGKEYDDTIARWASFVQGHQKQTNPSPAKQQAKHYAL